ncbi:hypothetical protein ABIF86_002232 [Bradyrhizobium japonicum]
MIATESQDRHRQFSGLCEQRFVVLAVLSEGSKLSAKGIADGIRTSIEHRIVIPGLSSIAAGVWVHGLVRKPIRLSIEADSANVGARRAGSRWNSC